MDQGPGEDNGGFYVPGHQNVQDGTCEVLGDHEFV